MKVHHIIILVIIGSTIAIGYPKARDYLSAPLPPESPIPIVTRPPEPVLGPTPQLGTNPVCDGALWQHVYHGRFPTAQDRLKVIESCKTVTGTIINAVAEKDGDYHIRLDVDDKSLLNAKNISGQHGYLILETICSNPVTQRDTLAEGVCDGFSQPFNTSLIGKRVEVTGAFVLDAEHLWNEIHPITSFGEPVESPITN